MKKKVLIYSLIAILLILGITLIYNNKTPLETNKITATINYQEDNKITVEDKNNIIYTFNIDNIDYSLGDSIIIEYTGLLDKNKEFQNVSVINYKTTPIALEDSLPDSWQDDGIFSNYYKLAYNKLKTLTLDEKIGQLILARYPENPEEAISKYKLSGFVFFEKDFKGKNKTQVIEMTSSLQKISKIPLLTATDEEGGKVARISSNPLLREEKFLSPSELYNEGGFELIKENTIEKSKLLNELGINLNLDPVVDVATDENAYIYERTLKQSTQLTSQYAKTVIKASHNTNVSYTLKHFPGYGNNIDTHTQTSSDNRTYDEILEHDIPPFKSGIDAGAEAVLVNHNTVTSIDNNNPASLSPSIHNLLRNELNFTGIIITDNLDMNAISSIDNSAVLALLAGNNLIITTDYKKDISNIKNALANGTLSESTINKTAFKILAWKYYKGLLFETSQK